ncbi:MAG: GNAT family N-acetyltransferase [Planctomycetota bacterium]|jgi:predicted acetyltransferase
MAKTKLTVTKPRKSEINRLVDVIADALTVPQENRKGFGSFGRNIGGENLRLVRVGNKIAGGLGILNMGQFWGGRSVKCAAVTIVGIAAEYRARGAAHRLMTQILKEERAKGTPLSNLYASTMKLYRKSGYEMAADRIDYEIETRDITVSDRKCDIELYEGKSAKIFRDFYRKTSITRNGLLDRNTIYWRERMKAQGRPMKKYIVRRSGKMEGYIFVMSGHWGKPTPITDMCFFTPAAGRRILALLRDMRSMVKQVTWSGGPHDGLTQLMEDPIYKAARNTKLLLRIVHLPKAFEARGYPKGVNAELHFDIEDDILPQNSGKWTLKISNGRGKVKKGGGGKIRISARSLAQLYAGYCAPDELAAQGDFNAPALESEKAAAVFTGPAPWCPDMF